MCEIYEWEMTCRKSEGPEWNIRKWKSVIGKVKCVGLNEWKSDMVRKLWNGIKKKKGTEV